MSQGFCNFVLIQRLNVFCFILTWISGGHREGYPMSFFTHESYTLRTRANH